MLEILGSNPSSAANFWLSSIDTETEFRGIAKRSKASDFDSDNRWFESSYPFQTKNQKKCLKNC